MHKKKLDLQPFKRSLGREVSHYGECKMAMEKKYVDAQK